MSQPKTPREWLAEADRWNALADAAEAARLNIRLWQRPVQEKRSGLIGWWRDRSTEPDPQTVDHWSPGLTAAVYDALGLVLRDAKERAKAAEANVTAVQP